MEHITTIVPAALVRGNLITVRMPRITVLHTIDGVVTSVKKAELAAMLIHSVIEDKKIGVERMLTVDDIEAELIKGAKQLITSSEIMLDIIPDELKILLVKIPIGT